MTAVKNVPVQPYFGGFVLETLTVGMYGEARNAIREYVQNGFDSIQRGVELGQLEPKDGLITVNFSDDRNGLTIRDNGAGLPVKVAAETLTAIGASRKDYRNDAGFRGIGRLAGIVFSNKVTFRTKAAGESEETEVAFKAELMRKLMSPGQGSGRTAEALLVECVEVRIHPSSASKPSFFEVALEGFTEAPEECADPKAMARFLGQVAPVPYRSEFPFGAEIRAAGEAFGIPIEEVRVVVEATGEAAPLKVEKPFKALYDVQNADGKVALESIEYFNSEKKRWWGWLGKKAAPGNYLDDDVRGIRVRAKNIQIDGEGVVREIFQKRAASSARFQEWFVGEIFVDLKSLTPNARRDGFEDTPTWREVREEIAKTICREAGSSAQSISNKGQLTLQKLTEKTEKIAENLDGLRKNSFKNQDRTLALSAEATKIHADVARAIRNAEPATSTDLQQLAARLLDAKSEAMQNLAGIEQKIDRERVEHEARNGLLGELLLLFEGQLATPCLSAVRTIIQDEYDFPKR